MNYSQKLLTELQAATGLPSDGRIAAAIGISRQSVSTIRTGTRQFCDETLVKIAHLMDVDPIKLLADKHIQCEESGIMRDVWTEILDKVNTAGALEFSGLGAEKVA